MRYLIGIIGFILGFVIIIYRFHIKQFTGNFGFAESWFGLGGTYTFLALFGILVSIGSGLWAFGVIGDLLRSVLGPLF